MSLDDYMTTDDIAAALGISKRGAQKLIEREVIPARKIGRDYLIDRQDFEAYLQIRRRPGRPKDITKP